MQRNTDRLARVGPVSGVHGFPLWYRDAGGVRLELGLDRADPNLPAIGDPPPAPVPGFPADFPDEAFYFLAEARMTTGGGPAPGRARLVLALEAAFGGTGEVAAGQQMVFARIRVRIDDAVPGASYTVTHPYGVTAPLPADDRGRVFVTEDIGAVPLAFGDVVRDGQVAPFLTWSGGSPGGHLGDGVTPHAVTGSPFGTNLFRIDGPRVGNVGAAAGGPDIDTVETDLFTVQGRLATVAGVSVDRAVYTRDAAGGVVVDVFATTESGQSIEAGGPGLDPTRLVADGERYTARAGAGTAVPARIAVVNRTDVPPTTVEITPVPDAVTVTGAVHDLAAHTLTVTARSSDAQGPVLTTTGDGLPPSPLAAGTVTIPGVAVPPREVVVTSVAGGSDRRTVELTGPVTPPVPVVAAAGADATAQQGQTVTLDGSGSAGPVRSFAWAQSAGPNVALADATASRTTFVAPAVTGDLRFTLTVDGPGGPATDEVTITVAAPVPAVAHAGADLTADVGATVTLDGSASTAALAFAWTQTGGTPVGPLTGADTARPGFVLPAGTGVLTFRLTVTGPLGDTATDEVTVVPTLDDLRVGAAQFRTGRQQWRVSGTATGRTPDRVTVVLDGREVGTALVDPTGAWDVRRTVLAAESDLRPAIGDDVTVTSTRGATQVAAVLVRN
jgi:hypothetical protein